MDKFMEFWALHGSTVTNFLIVSGGAIVTFLINRALKNTSNKFMQYSLGVVSQLFGGGTDIKEIENNVKELSFVKDIQTFIAEILEEKELRLINLKRLINNKKLTPEERLVYENEFEVLSKRLNGRLSENTIEVLNKLDEMSKEV